MLLTIFRVLMVLTTTFACLASYLVVRKLKREHKEELTRCKNLWYGLHEKSTKFWQTFVDQEQVDKVLTKFACDFFDLLQKEIQFQQQGADLGLIQDEVKAAKGNFWEAQNEAEDRGFQVRPSWRNYIPKGWGQKQ